MVNKLVNSLKRGLLYLSVPLALSLGSCSVNKSYIDEVYYTPEKPKLENKLYAISPTVEEDNWNYYTKLRAQDSIKKDAINSKESTEINVYLDDDWNYSSGFKRFRDPFFRFNLGFWDSDGDGIDDWADSNPYFYGPYADMNGNGIVDPWDLRVSGFGYSPWDYGFYSYYPGYDNWYYGGGFGYWDYPFYSHNYWSHSLWDDNEWNHLGSWHDWNNNEHRDRNRDGIYGHRNSLITDGPEIRSKEITNRSSTNTREFNSSRTYVKPETSSRVRVTSPQNKSNSSNARTTTQYRSSTNPTRTNNSSSSGAVRTYTPPQRSSSNTVQRSSSGSARSNSSSSGATRSGSSSGSSSSTRTGRR